MLVAPGRADCADARCSPPSTGHGVCKLGFCKCDEGWFGHDCAYRMEGVAYTPGSVSEGGCGGGIAAVGRVTDAACQTRLQILGASECARRVAHPKRPRNIGQVTRTQTGPGSRGRCARRRPRTRSRARSACGPASGCTSCPPTTTPCSCSTASQSTGRWAWIGATAQLGGQARDVRRLPRRNALHPPTPRPGTSVSAVSTATATRATPWTRPCTSWRWRCTR